MQSDAASPSAVHVTDRLSFERHELHTVDRPGLIAPVAGERNTRKRRKRAIQWKYLNIRPGIQFQLTRPSNRYRLSSRKYLLLKPILPVCFVHMPPSGRPFACSIIFVQRIRCRSLNCIDDTRRCNGDTTVT